MNNSHRGYSVFVRQFAVYMALLLGLLSFEVRSAGFDPNVIDRGVVRIVAISTSGKGASTGTGWLINRQGYVITNHHVIDIAIQDSSRSFVFDGSKDPSTASRRRFRIIDYNVAKDLALIKVEGLSSSRVPMTIADSESRHVKKSMAVYTIGFPGASDDKWRGIKGLNLDPVHKGGVISLWRLKHIRSNRIQARVFEHNATTNSGNSGGPLVDNCGRVLGVNQSKAALPVRNIRGNKIVYPEGTFWSVRSVEVVELLRKNNVAFKFTSRPCKSAAGKKGDKGEKGAKGAKGAQGEKGAKGEKGKDAPVWLLILLAAIVLILLVLFLVLWSKVKQRGKGESVSTYVRHELSRMLKRNPQLQQGQASRSEVVGRLTGEQRMSGINNELRSGSMVIGRSKKADIRVNDDGVGRQHARIGYDSATGSFWLEDLGSVNGTWLSSGKQVAPNSRVTLQPGDSFYLGNPDFSFRVHGK